MGATKTIGPILVGAVTAGAKAALSGMLISGVIGGLSAALYGGDVWDSIAKGAVQGAISGFVIGVAIYAVCSIISSVVQMVKAANRARIAEKAAQFTKTNNGTDFYVIPQGDAIPGTRAGLDNNLSKMQNANGKYIGIRSDGVQIRVRMESAHPTTVPAPLNLSPYHTIPHIHVEYRANIFTGAWGTISDVNKFTLPLSWF